MLMWQTSSSVIFMLRRLCVVLRTQLGVNGNPISSLLLWLWWAPLLRVLWVYANYSCCAYSHFKLRAWILDSASAIYVLDAKKWAMERWKMIHKHEMNWIYCTPQNTYLALKFTTAGVFCVLVFLYRNVYLSGHKQNAERVRGTLFLLK